MRRVWPDAFVEEGNLTKNIFFLRKALGPSDEGREYIENRAQREYWFTARVQTLSGEVEGTEVALPTASGTTRRRQRLNESTAEGASECRAVQTRLGGARGCPSTGGEGRSCRPRRTTGCAHLTDAAPWASGSRGRRTRWSRLVRAPSSSPAFSWVNAETPDFQLQRQRRPERRHFSRRGFLTPRNC